MDEFVARDVTFLEPLESRIATALRVDQVVLHYGRGRLDMGCLCYAQRRFPEKLSKWAPTSEVVLASLTPARATLTKRLVEHICLDFEHSGSRAISAYKRHSNIRRFVHWADTQGYSDVLLNAHNCEDAFQAYSTAVKDLVARNEISVNSGADRLLQKDFWADFWEKPDFCRGLAKLSRDSRAVVPTALPDEEAQTRNIAWLECVFDGLADAVLSERDYPFQIAVPQYIEAPGDKVWVFPSAQWAYSPRTLASSPKKTGFDLENGRLLTVAEWLAKQHVQGNATAIQAEARRFIRDAETMLVAANEDKRHFNRLRAASTAAMAFLLLFVANTGMNTAPVLSLPWSQALADSVARPGAERQGFRSVKYRAGGATVSFEVSIAFMPKLKKYLQLRAYLLKGSPGCDTLFFTSSLSGSNGHKFLPVSEGSVKSIFKTLVKRFDPQLEYVSPKKWRASVQDWAIQNTDPATAADLLQHSLTTALNRYSNGSETTQQNEIGQFLAHVEQVVIDRRTACQERAVGACVSPEHPAALTAVSPITPDCRKLEGCLFCDKYRVHADAEDIRKLVSCRHCIHKTAPLASSEEHFNSVYGAVLQRIQFILAEVAKREPVLVATITEEVDVFGELTPFWASKLFMLMELGLS